MPPTWTIITPLVSGCIFFSMSSGSIWKFSFWHSAKITLAPAFTTAIGVAIYVLDGTITVEPSTPIERNAISMELVPEFVATAYLVLQNFAKSSSNSATLPFMVR